MRWHNGRNTQNKIRENHAPTTAREINRINLIIVKFRHI